MTISVDYTSQNVFDSSGHTGNKYYCRIVGSRNIKIWNNVIAVMEESVSWADSVVILTEIGLTGEFPIPIPGLLPAGVYDIIVYHQAGSSEANTDSIEKQWIEVKGDIFGF